MEKKMMIDSEEGLVTWCKSAENGIRLQRRGAKIILDYLSGHGKMLSTNESGELFLNDEVMTEKTTLDDVVDLVCEWNYEALSDARERKENPDNFLDYCRCCTLEKTLEEHKFILDRVFKQTVYGKDVQTIAHKLAMEMMKEMRLVPIYDIPIADELGAFNKVSEKTEYVVGDDKAENPAAESGQIIDAPKLEQNLVEHDKADGIHEVNAAIESENEHEVAGDTGEDKVQSVNNSLIADTDPIGHTATSENKINPEVVRTPERIEEQGRSR